MPATPSSTSTTTTRTTTPRRPMEERLFLHEVVRRLRVMHDQRARRRLGHELVRARERHADRGLGREELEELRLVGEIRARAVAERIALAALLLEAQLLADLPVLPLGEAFRRRHAE